MAPTDLTVRRAKATGKGCILGYIDGLSLGVSAKERASWHFRYSGFGKQKRSAGHAGSDSARRRQGRPARIARRSIYEINRADLLEVVGRIEERKALSVAEKARAWFNNPSATPWGSCRDWSGTRPPTSMSSHCPSRPCATIHSCAWRNCPLSCEPCTSTPADIPPYIVPLSVQAIEAVRFMLDHFKPAQRLPLVHTRDLNERISENTVNGALKRLGEASQLTGHGLPRNDFEGAQRIGYGFGLACHARSLHIVDPRCSPLGWPESRQS